MELLHLLNLFWGFLTIVTWNLAVGEFATWNEAEKLAVICRVRCSSRLGCLRVGSDNPSSQLLVIRVGSQLCAHIMSSDWVSSHTFESARTACHWFGHSGRVGSSLFESARTACYWFDHSSRVGSSLFESARMIFCSEQLKHTTIESARQPFESARVHEFRKVLIITQFSY